MFSTRFFDYLQGAREGGALQTCAAFCSCFRVFGKFDHCVSDHLLSLLPVCSVTKDLEEVRRVLYRKENAVQRSTFDVFS